jgi:peptidoglycan L-alanyl-D-glutamate endopeptidase CwlK
MPKFSKTSKARLSTCHVDLQILFNTVVHRIDCTIITGHRGQEAQDMAYSTGKSHKQWPDGMHNKTPSLAVDVAPYFVNVGLDWDDHKAFYIFAGRVLEIANSLYGQGAMNYRVRCGADWDMDGRTSDQTLHDPGHYELVRKL